MTDERELREALRARAESVPVGRADEPGLGRRLVVVRRRRRQARIVGAASILVVALGAASLVSAGDEDGANVVVGPDPSPTTSTVLSSTTTAPAPVDTSTAPSLAPPTSAVPGTSVAPGTAATTIPRTTSTVAPLPPVPDDAIWPAPGSTTTFATPERAASDFTRRFLGMGTPQLGSPRVTGATAAVDVRPLPTSTLTTTVTLRRVDGRGWVVVGCAAATIQVEQPGAGAKVVSPLTVRGRARAFEGHVDVEVRSDAATAPLGRSFGTGGGDEVRPFEATVSFPRPPAPRGTVVVSEPRVDAGTQGPSAATVLRVTF